MTIADTAPTVPSAPPVPAGTRAIVTVFNQ
jgi:hypothetical protein